MHILEEYFSLCLLFLFKLILLAEIDLSLCLFAALYGKKYCTRDNRVTMETTKITIGIFFDFLV